MTPETKRWLAPIGGMLLVVLVLYFTSAWNIVPGWIWNSLVLLGGLILIFLVLIQRGKGGGLAGAFGGVGGSSPFGSRAGDMFMYVTIFVAAAWIFLIMFEVKHVQESHRRAGTESILSDNQ